ncbi:hypothetical protein BLNAU_21812 [Blattamonas nauphoetae]|uniref:Uncharacterized protein n=1 Tax=Blattamonas nauphoetae TaxID=2049346 RepID=A0ABQ9WVC4_9EUKA|nr:hypothetical protein BLNAU_21812 [Blattamonas nauphoetae]
MSDYGQQENFSQHSPEYYSLLILTSNQIDDKKALKPISQELSDHFQNSGPFLTSFYDTVPQAKPDNLKKLTNVDLFLFKDNEYMSDGMGKLIQIIERNKADKLQGSLCLDLIFLQETWAEGIVDDRMREREVKEKGVPDHEGQISEKKEINKSLKVDYSEDSKTRLTKLPRFITSYIPPKSLSSVPPFHTLYFTPLTVDLTDARYIIPRFPNEFKISLPLATPPPATSLKAPFQPVQSALHNLAFPFGSPASAGGRKASVASPNSHSRSTIGASGQTGSSAMPHFNLPAKWPQSFPAVQKKGAQSKKDRLKKVGSTCIPLTSLDRLSDVIMCDQFKLGVR